MSDLLSNERHENNNNHHINLRVGNTVNVFNVDKLSINLLHENGFNNLLKQHHKQHSGAYMACIENTLGQAKLQRRYTVNLDITKPIQLNANTNFDAWHFLNTTNGKSTVYLNLTGITADICWDMLDEPENKHNLALKPFSAVVQAYLNWNADKQQLSLTPYSIDLETACQVALIERSRNIETLSLQAKLQLYEAEEKTTDLATMLIQEIAAKNIPTLLAKLRFMVS